jgi:formate/nitrite transporter FocA (FNT family)
MRDTEQKTADVTKALIGILTWPTTLEQFGHFLLFTTIGNATGGAIFVALLKSAHARPEHGHGQHHEE